MKITNYVVGFLFSPDRKTVALIRKVKPAWQSGKLNGIGGKIEPHERITDAMVREFREETGMLVRDWRMFCTVHFLGGSLYCFETTGDHSLLRSPTDELVVVVATEALRTLPIIPNLNWLVPLACDRETLRTHAELYEEKQPVSSASVETPLKLGPDQHAQSQTGCQGKIW